MLRLSRLLRSMILSAVPMLLFSATAFTYLTRLIYSHSGFGFYIDERYPAVGLTLSLTSEISL